MMCVSGATNFFGPKNEITSHRRVEKSKKIKRKGGGVDENSDFLYEKRPIGGEKNRNYIAS
jgi:hypothetical protein